MKLLILLFCLFIITPCAFTQEKMEKVYTPKNVYGLSMGLVFDSKATGKFDEGVGGIHFEINYKYALIESYAGIGINAGGSLFLNKTKKENNYIPSGAVESGCQNKLGLYITPLGFVKFEPFYAYGGCNLEYLSKSHMYKYNNEYYSSDSKEDFYVHPVIGAGLMFFNRSINKNTQRWGFYIGAEVGFLNDKFLQNKISAGTVYVY